MDKPSVADPRRVSLLNLHSRHRQLVSLSVAVVQVLALVSLLPMTHAYVYTMTRAQSLEELADYRDDGGRDLSDPTALSDEQLRDLVKLARLRLLLWAGAGE